MAQNSENNDVPHLQIFLRKRPLIGLELEHEDEAISFAVKAKDSGFQVSLSDQNATTVVKPKGPLSPRSKLKSRMQKRRKGAKHAFSSTTFSGVFTDGDKNEKVFSESCAPLVDYALTGQTSLIFAYGNTGSGKTHTILGYGEERGMYYQAAQKLCEVVQEMNNADPEAEAVVRVQFAELHLDSAYDLMDDRAKSVLRENSDGEFVFRKNNAKEKSATNLKSVFCTEIGQIEEAVKAGVANRSCGTSTFHNQSSRSHAVLELEILNKELRIIQKRIVQSYWWWVLALNRDTDTIPKILSVPLQDCKSRRKMKNIKFDMNHKKFTSGFFSWVTEETKDLKFKNYVDAYKYVYEQWRALYEQRAKAIKPLCAKVIFVDLAGSEHGSNANRDLKQTPQELREGKKINLSLMTLNDVFRQKANGKRIKYRESTLTKVLRDSLESEKSKCLMMANISSSKAHSAQTISTLNYAAQLAKCF